MRPDHSRPAFRAWPIRLAFYGVAAVAAVVVTVAVLGRLLDGLPWLLVAAAQLGTGYVLGHVAAHVGAVLLWDWREAAGRELGAEFAELRRKWGLDGGSDDGTA